jgi:hypothetical protein
MQCAGDHCAEFVREPYFAKALSAVEVAMAHAIREDREQAKKETGASLMFIGLAVWVADALVAFFFPSAVRIGGQGVFLTIILVLAGMGLALMLSGYVMRGEPEE